LSECSPELFLYTDAHFGHAGGTGFQFIGLPKDPKARSFAGEIEQYLRIKLPTEMQIAAETGQKVLLPISMRILPLSIQGKTLISRTVPVGQVYRAEGTRGKPGNILAQALLFPAATNMDEVMSCAYLMPWASELDRKTHLDEKALDYPPFTVELPTGFLDVEFCKWRFHNAPPPCWVRRCYDHLARNCRRFCTPEQRIGVTSHLRTDIGMARYPVALQHMLACQ